MRNNQIILGPIDRPLAVFDRDVRGITYTGSVDVVGAELSIDVLTPTVDYLYNAESAQVIVGQDFGCIESSDGYIMCTNKTYVNLRETSYGTPIRYFRDGELRIKAYVKNVERSGVGIYRINAISAIGLLDSGAKHYGGIYTGQTFSEVLAEIIGGAVDYTVDDDVAGILIFGWLPYDSRRANLHILLFATGVMVGRNEEGDMHFRFLTNDEATAIPERRIYLGGDTDYSAPASAVQVTEHSFMRTSSDEEVVEYDNSDGSEAAEHTFVAFRNAPLYSLMVDGTAVDTADLPQTMNNMTVHAAGVNYAVISGTGVLSGKKYTHSTHVLTLEADESENLQENVATVAECTLISALNSGNVAQRVLAYYSSKRTVRSSIVLEDERPGDLIAAMSSYNEPFTGFISTMEATVSGIIKANCTVITDYVPQNGGNNYDTAEVLTGSGTFTITEEALVVLIGGGHGGQSGGDGEAGESGGGSSSYGDGGNGGAPGSGGLGGKVLTVRIPTGTYCYVSGVGGKGGISAGTTPTDGAEGGATELYDENGNLIYSSADGAVTPNGYANIITGEIYAISGLTDGINGGKGGKRNSYEPESVTLDGQTWTGGEAGSDYSNDGFYAYGAAGGGAAVGANGSDGGDGNGVSGGVGGSGGSVPAARSAADGIGNGGNPGHGGGGGGGGAFWQSSKFPGKYGSGGGPGGKGGQGGNGGPGGLVLYTKSREGAA